RSQIAVDVALGDGGTAHRGAPLHLADLRAGGVRGHRSHIAIRIGEADQQAGMGVAEVAEDDLVPLGPALRCACPRPTRSGLCARSWPRTYKTGRPTPCHHPPAEPRWSVQPSPSSHALQIAVDQTILQPWMASRTRRSSATLFGKRG